MTGFKTNSSVLDLVSRHSYGPPIKMSTTITRIVITVIELKHIEEFFLTKVYLLE